ncbi:uncharacterized protein TNIN_441471 [Trichonephila inaurata madagascariensis]|uniref:Uncharacterized protein n=1 Tax=Trichonephila inaurata madagascariensis TaxID=2747483 RepID=A0A8X6XIM0_9ARAC|nr:uncharacterized protein TNIN_441471 [Trichonephila inaurata madagascariensis]
MESGRISHRCLGGMAFSNSSLKIIRIFLLLRLCFFLLLIILPVTYTIYTTLHYATNIAKSHGQKTCLITFDQPLYSKAREIVAASDGNSELCKIVVKLGGFMSSLGSIGYIMDGSGLKEALGKIYATNSVDKMLNGHAYSSIREVIYYYDLHYQ